MVEDNERSFKIPGAVPYSWEIEPGVPKIRPGVTKTRTTKPDDGSALLQPPKKLSPLRLKQLLPGESPPSSPKTSAVSPFAPPQPFKLKPHPDSRSSPGRPAPYLRCSSARASHESGTSSPRRGSTLLKSLFRFIKSKSRDVKNTVVEDSTSSSSSSSSSESDNTYDSKKTTFSPSLLSSFGLKRNESDLSSSEKKIILMMSRDYSR